MLRIFRQIRKSEFMKEKVSKYVLYAVGEILLVVVGILIALQINNWNEGRKEIAFENQVLKNLKVELQDNLVELDSIAADIDKVIHALEKVFDLFSSKVSDTSIDSLDIMLSGALASPNWRPSEYLLNNLKNSGIITDLRSDTLKLLLYEWSRQQNELLEVQLRSEETGEEIITYLKKYGSLRNVDVASIDFNYRRSEILNDNQNLLSDYQFENHINDKLFMYKLTQMRLEEARVILVKLIEATQY